jgi:hypothetical protein
VEPSTSGPDFNAALLAPVARARVAEQLGLVLGLPAAKISAIVAQFETTVAQPLESNLKRLNGRDLAKRNPMIYTARGTVGVDEWIDRVLADKETSAIESHIGTWLEEVARIVSDGIKPGSGVDLQIEDADGVVQLYAIQASPSTKNAGSRKSDIEALKRGARPLRAARRLVELNVGVLHGQKRTSEVRAEPGVKVIASDEFWARVSGIPDFRARLLRATAVLSDLISARSDHEIDRIRGEARMAYDDGSGQLDMDALANPPAKPRVISDTQLSLDLVS